LIFQNDIRNCKILIKLVGNLAYKFELGE